MNDQNKKIVLITGATGSIGSSIVDEFLKNDSLVIATARSLENLTKLKSKNPQNIITYSLDLTEEDGIIRLFKDISERYGHIDVLVNTAGGGPLGGVKDLSDAVWTQNINLKLMGYIRMSKHAIPLLKKAKFGRIINIIGTFGKQPSPFFAVGSVINSALLSLTKTLSLELSSTNITVNAINPGAVKSTLWSNTVGEIIDNNMTDAKFLTSDLVKLVDPEDVARATVFLSDEKSNSINGTTLHVDFGAYSGF